MRRSEPTGAIIFDKANTENHIIKREQEDWHDFLRLHGKDPDSDEVTRESESDLRARFESTYPHYDLRTVLGDNLGIFRKNIENTSASGNCLYSSVLYGLYNINQKYRYSSNSQIAPLQQILIYTCAMCENMSGMLEYHRKNTDATRKNIDIEDGAEVIMQTRRIGPPFQFTSINNKVVYSMIGPRRQNSFPTINELGLGQRDEETRWKRVLRSTTDHSFKIYVSDEERLRTMAAIFIYFFWDQYYKPSLDASSDPSELTHALVDIIKKLKAEEFSWLQPYSNEGQEKDLYFYYMTKWSTYKNHPDVLSSKFLPFRTEYGFAGIVEIDALSQIFRLNIVVWLTPDLANARLGKRAPADKAAVYTHLHGEDLNSNINKYLQFTQAAAHTFEIWLHQSAKHFRYISGDDLNPVPFKDLIRQGQLPPELTSEQAPSSSDPTELKLIRPDKTIKRAENLERKRQSRLKQDAKAFKNVESLNPAQKYFPAVQWIYNNNLQRQFFDFFKGVDPDSNRAKSALEAMPKTDLFLLAIKTPITPEQFTLVLHGLQIDTNSMLDLSEKGLLPTFLEHVKSKRQVANVIDFIRNRGLPEDKEGFQNLIDSYRWL